MRPRCREFHKQSSYMIRIRFHLIRIRIQHFRLNGYRSGTNPDPGFWWPKIYKFTAECKVFWIKTYNLGTLLASIKKVQATEEALSPQKSTSSTWNFLFFSIFVGHFCLPADSLSGSGYESTDLIRNTDYIWTYVQYVCVCSLACGECSAVVSVDEAGSHVCSSPRLSFDCPACRHPFPSQEDLESHIVNMWCPKLRICDSTPSVRDIQVRIYDTYQYF